MDFYGSLCAGRNMQAITAVREKIGFTNDFIRSILESDLNYHKDFKDAVLRLVKTLIIDYQPYIWWIND